MDQNTIQVLNNLASLHNDHYVTKYKKHNYLGSLEDSTPTSTGTHGHTGTHTHVHAHVAARRRTDAHTHTHTYARADGDVGRRGRGRQSAVLYFEGSTYTISASVFSRFFLQVNMGGCSRWE